MSVFDVRVTVPFVGTRFEVDVTEVTLGVPDAPGGTLDPEALQVGAAAGGEAVAIGHSVRLEAAFEIVQIAFVRAEPVIETPPDVPESTAPVPAVANWAV